MSLFAKKVKPEELVRKWKVEIRKELRGIDGNIRNIELEEKKVQKSIQELLKRGDKKSATMLAKELLKSKKAKERMHTTRATLNSVSMQLQSNLSMMRVTGIMEKSSQIMTMMNNVVKLPQLNETMRVMSQEMMKAGLIEEMMDEAFEDDEIEEAADEEIEKVLFEITNGVFNKGPKVPVHTEPAANTTTIEDEEESEKDNALAARLAALKQ